MVSREAGFGNDPMASRWMGSENTPKPSSSSSPSLEEALAESASPFDIEPLVLYGVRDCPA
jgi:hypothetical protein